MKTSPRIHLIHATSVAIAPINDSFSRLWPEAVVFNLLDDALTPDLKAAGGNIDAMTPRFVELTRYAVQSGADGVLFTCSSFGPAVEAAQSSAAVPVLKPNEAMIEEAAAIGTHIALVATFEPALAPIRAEFGLHAQQNELSLQIEPFLVPGAWEAIQRGDQATHDRLIVETCAAAAHCDVVCFAQFSMTKAQPAAEQASGKPTLATPDSAVRKMKSLLGQERRTLDTRI
ncbi:aspartate/glutamate racemase family protein [Burkholderia sp. 22PA0106]|uniref:aspartate/glutamate racemase family protein n=1 Tax=Burkholderia sp. 22PA0106 TaxID=3237371 RepID=UPI0039C0B10F